LAGALNQLQPVSIVRRRLLSGTRIAAGYQWSGLSSAQQGRTHRQDNGSWRHFLHCFRSLIGMAGPGE
jgi:hypothetical protein